MEEKGKIYSAIVGVMEDIKAVGKDQVNKQQNFKYRGIDDVMNALAPALTKNRVFVLPEILKQEREQHTTAKGSLLIYSICTIRFRFYTDDGSFVEAVTIGEGMDSGDKATNKAMAAAFKYACFQTFCIPTEEMRDPDADSPEPVAGNRRREATEMNGKRNSQAAGRTNTAESASAQGDGSRKVTPQMVSSLYSQLKRTGVGLKGLLVSYGVGSAEELTVDEYKDAMDRLIARPDKNATVASRPENIPDQIPESDTFGLPFR